jgi:hypothetical protein
LRDQGHQSIAGLVYADEDQFVPVVWIIGNQLHFVG